MVEEKNILSDESKVSETAKIKLTGIVLCVAELAKFFSGDKTVIKSVHRLCEKIVRSFGYAEYAVTAEDKSVVTGLLDELTKSVGIIRAEKNTGRVRAAIASVDRIIAASKKILDENKTDENSGIGAAVEGIRRKIIVAGGVVRDKIGEGISKIKKAIGKGDSE